MHSDDLTSVSLARLTQADNWQAKYRLITQWGSLIAVKPELRQPQHLIKGCETSAWLSGEKRRDGRFYFWFDSDSRVMKGLAALLLSLVNDKSTTQLAGLDFSHVLRDAGLESHMTPSRNNGFRAIVLRVNELLRND